MKKRKIVCTLKKVLAQRGISLLQFSHLSNVSYPTLDRMVKNKTSSYDTEVLARISQTLDVPLSELLESVEVEDIEEFQVA